jgi:hypothetical protein
MFALIYPWELHLVENVFVLSLRLMICPVMCAWCFPLHLDKIRSCFSCSLGKYTWQLLLTSLIKEKTCLYMLLVSTFKFNISYSGVSSSSPMKKWEWQLFFLLKIGLIFFMRIRYGAEWQSPRVTQNPSSTFDDKYQTGPGKNFLKCPPP